MKIQNATPETVNQSPDNTVANDRQYSGQKTDNTVAKGKHQMDNERTTKHFRKKIKIEPRLKLKVASAVPQG